MRLFIPNPSDLPLQHIDYPWYLGSPDALIVADDFKSGDNAIGGVDFKTTGRRDGWGEPGTDEVPEWIHTQADWYMGLTGAEWWDIAVLFFSPRREFAIYRINRNQELIDNLIEAGKDFWENHVVPQIPPPIDASEGSKKLLNHLYPRETEELLQSNETIDEWVKRLKKLEEVQNEGKEHLTFTQNIIKDIIGTYAGVQTSLGKITWKKSKDRQEVDWKGVSDILTSHLAGAFNFDTATSMLAQARSQSTIIRPGSRVFRSWWKKEEA